MDLLNPWTYTLQDALDARQLLGIALPVSGDHRPAVASTMREEPAQAGGPDE